MYTYNTRITLCWQFRKLEKQSVCLAVTCAYCLHIVHMVWSEKIKALLYVMLMTTYTSIQQHKFSHTSESANDGAVKIKAGTLLC